MSKNDTSAFIRTILQKGNINAKDKKNSPPLHYACWKGQTNAVEFLLSSGAQVAECDSSLKTALPWAVRYGHCDTLHVLLKVLNNVLYISLCWLNTINVS